MELSAKQKKICEQVINVFETGKIAGDYAALVTLADGPHGMRQVTYGRSQTTEFGNLKELVQMYVDAHGTFSDGLRPFIEMITRTPLADNNVFKQLLRDAGRNDAVMRQIQDKFFDKRYFQPAMQWADANQFKQPLSALVIYDSFIHSGSILPFLRNRFPEVPPAKGGNEKKWIQEYVDVRDDWLRTHTILILRNTTYRTECFKREILRNNWDLASVPINANGTNVSGQ
jgi:chitosanase